MRTFTEWLEINHPECLVDEGVFQNFFNRPAIRNAITTAALTAGSAGLLGGGQNTASAADAQRNRPTANTIAGMLPGQGQSMTFVDVKNNSDGSTAYYYQFKGYADDAECAQQATKAVRQELTKDQKGAVKTIEGLGPAVVRDMPGKPGIKIARVVVNPKFSQEMGAPMPQNPAKYLRDKYGPPVNTRPAQVRPGN